MITKEKIVNSEKRIHNACKKFINIQKQNTQKFKDLDLWLLKKSNIFEKELTYKPKTFMKYKRGTIIKVDFGINIGCELSNIHFAIVMDNNDNIYKETIAVIPLTSKSGNYKIDLGSLIYDEFLKKINVNDKKNNEEINELLQEYKKYNKKTYANVSQFKCISKNRIIYPKNNYDIIGKTRISKEVMNKLNLELQKLYLTNFILK